MTRIRSGSSSRVQDRRGQGGGGGMTFPGLGSGGSGMGIPMKGGGGIIGLLVTGLILFLSMRGGNAGQQVITGDQTAQETQGSAPSGDCETDLEQILCGANDDVQAYWEREYPAAFSGEYEYTDMIWFSGSTQTGCGAASSQTGPFYCPADHFVYFDLDFLVQLQDQFGATGDLATAYIVAHEFGHHIQNITGQMQPPSDFNGTEREFGILVELQADCYAGTWAKDASGRKNDEGLPLFESPDEVNEAINAARAVGDDRIQEQTTGRVDPDQFTHGTADQRAAAFQVGFESGDPKSCDMRELVG